MRALDRGEVFLVTRNGIPVGELRPAQRRFVDRDLLLEVFASALVATLNGSATSSTRSSTRAPIRGRER